MDRATAHRIETLEIEVERLRQENEALKEAFRAGQSGRSAKARALKLTPTQAAIVDLLLARKIISRYALTLATEPFAKSNRCENTKVGEVQLCKLRRKLEPHGVTIDNVFAEGWSLSTESRDRLTALLAPEPAREAA